MSFLAPLFLLGGLAIALPVVLHLIRRTTREKMPFSSLMFLFPTPPRVTKRSRLENLWLLLLRCLVIGLLALGFSRPFLQKKGVADPSRRAGRTLVVLVDVSASMQREDLWAQAVDRAEGVLKNVTPADQVAVFTFDRSTYPVMSFEQWRDLGEVERTRQLRQSLAELKPGWGATHLGPALLRAVEAMDELDSEPAIGAKREIVVMTDFQEGSRLDGLQGFEWPQDLEVTVEKLEARSSSNAGLQLVGESEEWSQAPVEGGPRVRVVNAANSGQEQFRLGWVAAGQKTLSGETAEVYVPPGQNRIFRAPVPPTGSDGQHLLLTGDQADFDNAVFVVPDDAENVRILFLGNAPPDDPNRPLYYLKRAFPEGRRQRVEVQTAGEGQTLAPSTWEQAACVVAVGSMPEPLVTALRDYLKKGGVALMALQSAQDAATLAGILEVGQLRMEEAVVDEYAMLGQIDFQHPLFAPFADPRYSDFTKIHFWKYRRLYEDELRNARLVARFDRGDPALVQCSVGAGTLLVLASGWQPSDSQLALSTKFVPMLYSLLELSGRVTSRAVRYYVGDEFPLTMTNVLGGMVLRYPDGSEVPIDGARPFSRRFTQPGIHTLVAAARSQSFAVNVFPGESLTMPLNGEDLERLGVRLKHETSVEVTRRVEEQERQQQNSELENRQKLWRWLLVGAFLALLLETWISGRLSRVPTGEAVAS